MAIVGLPKTGFTTQLTARFGNILEYSPATRAGHPASGKSDIGCTVLARYWLGRGINPRESPSLVFLSAVGSSLP